MKTRQIICLRDNKKAFNKIEYGYIQYLSGVYETAVLTKAIFMAERHVLENIIKTGDPLDVESAYKGQKQIDGILEKIGDMMIINDDYLSNILDDEE
jgi:hypothetical protein